MVICDKSLPWSELLPIMIIIKSLSGEVPDSLILTKRKIFDCRGLVFGLIDRQSNQWLIYITIINTHGVHLVNQRSRRKRIYLIILGPCAWRLNLRRMDGVYVLRQVDGNLLGGQFDMVFIILCYMLYRIRLFNIVKVHLYLPVHYLPQVQIELRM